MVGEFERKFYLEKIIPFIALKEINLNPNQTNEMKFDWKNLI